MSRHTKIPARTAKEGGRPARLARYGDFGSMVQGSSWTRSKRSVSFAAAALFVAVIAASCSAGAASRPPTATPSTFPTVTSNLAETPAESSTAVEATPQVDPTIAAAVDKLLADTSGVYGVVFMKPDGTILYGRNSRTPFIAASLYKLVLMVEIYELREQGDLKFSDTVTLNERYFPLWNEAPDPYFPLTYIGADVSIEEALFATGAYSSNVSARALLALTSPDELQQTAQRLGLNDTYMFVDLAELDLWPPTASVDSLTGQTDEALDFINASAAGGPINITTPNDMCLFFSKLVRGEIVNPTISQEIFTTLEQQKIGDRFPMLLPDGTRLVHKTGNLEHVAHDVGIIYGPNGPVILAAMSEGQINDDVAYQTIQRLASIAYGDLDVFPTTASPVGGMTSQATEAAGSTPPNQLPTSDTTP